MAFGAGSQGTIRYAVVVDTQAAQQSIGTFKQAITGLGGPTQAAANSMKGLVTAQQPLAQNMNQSTTAAKGLGLETVKLTTSQKTLGTETTTLTQTTKTMGAETTKLTSSEKALGAETDKLAKSTKQTGSDMGALSNNFKGVQGGLTKTNTLIGLQTKDNKTLGQSVKDVGRNFAGFGTAVSATGASVIQLAAGFRDYNDAQIAVDRAQARLSTATEAENKAQDKLNALVAKGITSGKDFKQAQLDLGQAHEKVKIQTQLVGEAEERRNDSQSYFATSVIPTVIGASATLASGFTDMKALASSTREMFGKLGTRAGELVTKIKGVDTASLGASAGLAGIGRALGAIGAAVITFTILDQITKRLEEMNPKLKENRKSMESFWDTVGKQLGKIPGFEQLQKSTRTFSGDIEKMVKNIFPGYIADEKLIAEANKNHAETEKQKSTEIAKSNKVTEKAIMSQQDFNQRFEEGSKTYEDYREGVELGSDALEDNIENTSIAVEKTIDYTAAIEANDKAMRSGNTRADELRQHVEDLTSSTTKHQQELVKQAQALGLTDDEIRQYTNDFNKSDQQVQESNIQLEGAIKRINELKDSYKNLHPEISQNSKDIAAWNTALERTANGSGQALDVINEVLKDLPDNEKLWGAQIIKNTAELAARNKQLEEARKKAEAWHKTVEEFSKTKLDVAKLFGFDKKFNADKVFKDMVKDLPSKLEKNLKGTLKANFKIEETKAGVKQFIESFMMTADNLPGQYFFNPELHADKKTAIAYGKDVLDHIKDIPDADTKAAGEQLAKAISKGNMGDIVQAITDVLKTLDPPPIPVYLVSDPKNEKNIQTEVNKWDTTAAIKGEITEVTSPWEGFDAHSPAGFEMDLGGGKGRGGTSKVAATVPVQGKIIRVFAENAPPGTVNPTPTPPAEVFDDTKKFDPSQSLSAIQTLQKAIDSLKTYGIRNLAALAKESSSAMRGMSNNFKVGTVGAQHLQTGLANLSNQGSKSLGGLAKESSSAMSGMSKNMKVGEVAAQKLQKGIANLSNEGSKSFKELAKASSSSMNGIVNNVQYAQRAVISLAKSIGNLHSKTIEVKTIHTTVNRTVNAQHGFHGVVTGPTPFMTGEAGPEYVSVTPLKGGAPTSGYSATGGRGVAGLTVNLTNVLADREIIRTYRRKLGEDMYRFGPT